MFQETVGRVRQAGRRIRNGMSAARVARTALLAPLVVLACDRFGTCDEEDARDEATLAGRTVRDFPEASVDAFKGMDMDSLVPLDTAAIMGRNTWMLWAGGNESFWDWMAQHGFGTTDLLRLVDSRDRGTRFARMGLVNDPNMVRRTTPDSLGLYLDSLARPEREQGIDPAVYGYPSGVVGLRLFPNPRFDSTARRKWDARRFYTDARYFNDPRLVRPYRVGMACAFCHVAPHPLNPPADPESPRWENLSAAIGNQYFRTKNVFTFGSPETSLVYQIVQANRDGTLDTSFLGTDQVLNPSNMNPIFEVGARLQMASTHRHELTGGTRALQGLRDSASMGVPHILKDGADNVGILGALSRVYINIGTFHEQWRRNHDILLGVKPQTPFPVEKANVNSVYWQVTEHRVNNLARYFLRATSSTPGDPNTRVAAMRLEDAPGGAAYLTTDTAVLNRGKLAFANECASCHSSKRPPAGVAPRSEQGLAFFRQSVMAPDFRVGNYLSTDDRIPLHVVQTNACRAIGMNAVRGHVWDNFSSETYKTAAAPESIQVYNPWTKAYSWWQPPGGGRGYYRVPPLVSIWSSAPFLHNNELGPDSHDPSVAGRMQAFNAAAEQLLWPERRRGPASVQRTTADSYLRIPTSYLPGVLQKLANDSAFLEIGPIPAGTPVGLLASADLQLKGWGPMGWMHGRDVAAVLRETKLATWEIKRRNLTGEAATAVLRERVVPRLLAISNCPDFITDKGHHFGSELSDADKRALIEFLKTL